MPEFIAEQYISRTRPAAVRHSVGAARGAAQQVTCDGASVRLLRSVFVSEDETCIHLYEADSIESVRLAAAHAGPRLERIAPALSDAGAVGADPGDDERPIRVDRTITPKEANGQARDLEPSRRFLTQQHKIKEEP